MAQHIQFDCPHCGMKQAGFELRSYYAVSPIPEKTCSTHKVEIAAQFSCPNISCRKPLTAILKFRSNASVMSIWGEDDLRKFISRGTGGRFDMDYWQVMETLPAPKASNAPKALPSPVLRVFSEAENNLANGSFESAALMYGKALDIASVQVGVDEEEKTKLKGMSLHSRIDWLGRNGRIAGDLAKWAKELKWARNDSMHEEDGALRADAEAIGEATRLILIYLFEMPARAKQLEAKYNPASPQAGSNP